MPHSKLLENAVASIQLGVEDYQSNDPRRPVSAARNFFSGILLLAKEVLVVAAPSANPDLILAAKTKPLSDGAGGIKHVAAGSQTVDFSTLGERLKDFDIKVDQVALTALNKIRNDIEHRYTTQTAAAVRQAIAKAFPVVLDLCRELDTTPSSLLGDAWPTMIGVKDVYDSELAKCKETFAKVNWMSQTMSGLILVCPNCHSDLVRQDDPENADCESIIVTCQSCGNECDGEKLATYLVGEKWGASAYEIATGDRFSFVHTCPSCNLEAYVADGGLCECTWCGYEMGECRLCEDALTSDNVSFNNERLCCYCEHKLSKDD